MRTIWRRPPLLTQQIVRYLGWLGEPCHYRLLARILGRSTEKVLLACVHLTNQGQLTRVRAGTYTLADPGKEARDA